MPNLRFWKKTKAQEKDADSSSSDGARSIDEKRGGEPSNRAEEILQEAQEQTAEHEGEDEIEYPRAWKLAIITIALMLSVFCVSPWMPFLSSSLINVE